MDKKYNSDIKNKNGWIPFRGILPPTPYGCERCWGHNEGDDGNSRHQMEGGTFFVSEVIPLITFN